MKVIGINVMGLNRWIWFNARDVQEGDGRFKGVNGTGTGYGGAKLVPVSIDVPLTSIEGRIETQGMLK